MGMFLSSESHGIVHLSDTTCKGPLPMEAGVTGRLPQQVSSRNDGFSSRNVPETSDYSHFSAAV